MYKVLFVTGKLQNYRIPIFNIISANKDIELTVAHAGKPFNDPNNSFKEIILKEKKIRGIIWHEKSFIKMCQSFDVVVAMFYVQRLSLARLAFIKKRKYKLIYWGIGVRASQKSHYDSPGFSNIIRYILAKRSDGLIFYSDYPINKYVMKGIDRTKIFVMNNTVSINHYIEDELIKNNFLFVGTLQKSKKIFVLLESYLKAFQRNRNLPKLKIIGDGPDYETIKNWILNHSMDQSIILLGAIYDESILERHFKEAIICISPGQAGLSVLKSMGYGVPFVTRNDSITGGERFNIDHLYNGLLYEKDFELENILIDAAENVDKYLKMGQNAKLFYENFRTPELMAKGFIDSVQYVMKKS